jgi:hypothetical protein
MTKCLECGKPLKLIGVERKNGKGNYQDWASREYHKCCWKKIQNFNLFSYYICQQIEKNTSNDTKLQTILNK